MNPASGRISADTRWVELPGPFVTESGVAFTGFLSADSTKYLCRLTRSHRFFQADLCWLLKTPPSARCKVMRWLRRLLCTLNGA